MIITLLVLFVFLVGVFCTIVYNLRDCGGEGWYYAALFPMIICAKSHIVKIEAIRETFKSARIDENIHPLELAAIQHKVAEKNEWIANAQFWTAQPLTNWFWSKRILEIEPIK